MTLNLFSLLVSSELLRGRKMKALMLKFKHAVENQETPDSETLDFFSKAFSQYLKWSDENPDASNDEKKNVLATCMQLDLRNKGKPSIEPLTVAEHNEFWTQPRNILFLQFEELVRRKAEDREGRRLKKGEIAQAVAKGCSSYVTMDASTLERDSRRGVLPSLLDTEFERRKSIYICLLAGVGGIRTQYFFKTCFEDIELRNLLYTRKSDN